MPPEKTAGDPPRGRGRGPWRALAFAGVGAFIVGLAFLVARPRAEPPAATPYAGARGASRAHASGLEVRAVRGGELHVIQPGTPLQAGDTLRFVVRGERPRYVVVRVQDAGASAPAVFPASGQAVAARPGETLPFAPSLGAAPGKVLVSALYADRPFPVGAAPDPDTEVVNLVMEKAAP